MRNDFKMVITDLDGTLLQHDGTVALETRDYLIGLQEKGIMVVVATGRNPKETFQISSALRCVDFKGYMVCCNGQLIHSFGKGDDIEGTRVTMKEGKELALLAKQFNIMVGVDNDEAYYQSKTIPGFSLNDLKSLIKRSKWIFNQLNSRHIHRVSNVEDYINKDIRKIAFSGHPKRLQMLASRIRELYPEYFSVMFVSPNWLEVMDINVSKGHALLTLSSITGIGMDEMIAFGDGENDLTMLKMSGWGVAMENAMDSVKSIAKDIAPRNTDQGVMNYLKKIGM